MLTIGATAANSATNSNGQPGAYVVPPISGLSASTYTFTANRAIAVRFVPSRNMAITKIQWLTGVAAGANDNCDAGIYDSSLNKIVTSGATAGKLNTSANTVNSVALTAALTAGKVYYVALACGTLGGSAGQTRSLQTISGQAGWVNVFGSTAPFVEAFHMDTAYTLPNPLTITGVDANFPAFILSEQ